jgi:hypothetical protein
MEMKYRTVLSRFDQLDGKDFAVEMIDYCRKQQLNTGILFSMKNGSNKWKRIIWDLLQPVFEKASKTVHEMKREEAA